MKMTWRGRIAAVVIALACPAGAFAAGRTVTIEVRDSQNRPVDGATVRIAADEMDAVGTTDAAGRVTVETTSALVKVYVESGNQSASATANGDSITVTLKGAAE